jgi:hypothetical protein
MAKSPPPANGRPTPFYAAAWASHQNTQAGSRHRTKTSRQPRKAGAAARTTAARDANTHRSGSSPGYSRAVALTIGLGVCRLIDWNSAGRVAVERLSLSGVIPFAFRGGRRGGRATPFRHVWTEKARCAPVGGGVQSEKDGFQAGGAWGLTREDMLRALSKLGELLEESGIEADIVIAGGAWMALVLGAREVTRHIDAYLAPPTEPVRKAAAQVAEQLGLPEDWLNDGIKGFFFPSPPQTLCAAEHCGLFRFPSPSPSPVGE